MDFSAHQGQWKSALNVVREESGSDEMVEELILNALGQTPRIVVTMKRQPLA